MNNISEKVNGVLGSLFEHYYNCMPEFAENEEPDRYAVYFIRDKPVNFASGVYHNKSYWVSVSIISLSYDRTLYRQTEKAFFNAGFTYAGGTDLRGYETSEPYPHRHGFSQEYIIDMEV